MWANRGEARGAKRGVASHAAARREQRATEHRNNGSRG